MARLRGQLRDSRRDIEQLEQVMNEKVRLEHAEQDMIELIRAELVTVSAEKAHL